MIVDLLSVTDVPVPFDFEVKPDEIDLETDGVRVIDQIHVVGEISRNVAKTDVHGSIKTPAEIECTRCLTPVKLDLDIGFQVDFVAREMLPEGKETQLEDADLDTDMIEGNLIDLTELAREQILLSLPETVLCREDCKGICPTCGKDLNEGRCQCGDEEIDPRWAALKNLR
jgi:uncharacterized protein